MLTLTGLNRRIRSTEDLQSVVRTMKALAAVSIRQYEKAVESLRDYSRAVDMALQVILRSVPGTAIRARRVPGKKVGAIVFGSDHGMCGPLNEQVVSHAVASMGDSDAGEKVILAVGVRVRDRMGDAGYHIEHHLPVPGSVAGIGPGVRDLLLEIERWQSVKGIGRILLFHSVLEGGASYHPREFLLLPVDEEWLAGLRKRSWPTRVLPTFTGDREALFSAVIREYMFISLFRAFAESLASENASRLASMQAADKNIEDQLSELRKTFHQMRQMTITEELLDIVSGFEALTGGKGNAKIRE